MRTRLPLVAILVVSCGGAQPRATPPSEACRGAGVAMSSELEADTPELAHAIDTGVAQACADDRWSAETIACMSSGEPSRCALSPAQQASLGEHLQIALRHLDDLPADTSEPDCDEFLRRYNRFQMCTSIPASTRVALRAQVRDHAEMWRRLKNPGTPDARRHLFALDCRESQTRLEATAQALGCPTTPDTLPRRSR